MCYSSVSSAVRPIHERSLALFPSIRIISGLLYICSWPTSNNAKLHTRDHSELSVPSMTIAFAIVGVFSYAWFFYPTVDAEHETLKRIFPEVMFEVER